LNNGDNEMPIIHMGTLADKGKPDFKVFAKAGRVVREYVNGEYVETAELIGPFIEYTTFTSHTGFCLREYEHNGYHDSDFFMTVWNPETHQPENIEFASTRGWSYPCYGSAVDATAEVKAAYAQYLDAEARLADMRALRNKISAARAFHDDCRVIAAAADVPTGKVLRLARSWGKANVQQVASMFRKSLRSTFKLNLKAQVIAWLKDPNPKYATPLSPKQLSYFC
jgi:hypothetical protein